MDTPNIPPNRRSIRTRFAYRFLRALKKLKKQRTSTTPTSARETYRRYHMVKMAAYGSMASAVGSKRAWSRALLWKIRNRGLNRSFVKRSKTRALRERSTTMKQNPNKNFGFKGADGLRKLVPGGEVMDLMSLFEETGHYIKCLTSQVQIMRNILDFYSA